MGAFGGLVKSQREAKGLTQAQLATLVGVTQPAVAQWENGDGYPEARRVGRLAVAIDVSAEWLLKALADDVEETPTRHVTPPKPHRRLAGRNRRRGA